MDIERDVLCFLKYHQALIEEQLRPSFEQRMRQYDVSSTFERSGTMTKASTNMVIYSGI